MNPRHLPVLLLFILLVSCSSEPKSKFKNIVSRIESYLSERPVLLTSNKIIKDGKGTYAYYALKIVDHKASYNINRSPSSDSPFTASVRISLRGLANTKDGDIFASVSGLQTGLEIISSEAQGFSTTDLALKSNMFSTECNWTMILDYSYTKGRWTFNGIEGSAPSQSFFRDLDTFPQNEEFMHVTEARSQDSYK